MPKVRYFPSISTSLLTGTLDVKASHERFCRVRVLSAKVCKKQAKEISGGKCFPGI
jgi:hypothetical protein